MTTKTIPARAGWVLSAGLGLGLAIGLVGFGGTAEAAPAAAGRASSADTCKPSGDVVLEQRERVLGVAESMPARQPPKLPTWHLTVYASGAWSRSDTAANDVVTTVGGCVSPSIVAKLRADLTAATWKHARAAASCDALALAVTDLIVGGKTVWTDELCSPEVLDAASAKAYADLKATLATAQKATPAPPQ